CHFVTRFLNSVHYLRSVIINNCAISLFNLCNQFIVLFSFVFREALRLYSSITDLLRFRTLSSEYSSDFPFVKIRIVSSTSQLHLYFFAARIAPSVVASLMSYYYSDNRLSEPQKLIRLYFDLSFIFERFLHRHCLRHFWLRTFLYSIYG